MDECFMIKKGAAAAPLDVEMIYIYPLNGSGQWRNLAMRFVESYHKFPPDYPHSTTVVLNNGMVSKETTSIFGSLPKVRYYQRRNTGKDIGAYIELSKNNNANAALYCGTSVYFHRSGWLRRLIEAYSMYGPGMYGTITTNFIRTHMGTTFFLCWPKYLAQYDRVVASDESRYEFERGTRSLWRQLVSQNIPVKMVTWDGEYDYPKWRTPENIFRKGDQSNCLAWCNHTDAFLSNSPEERQFWNDQVNAEAK